MEETNFYHAAMTWNDIDLVQALEDESDARIVYVLCRMWLAQMMAEFNVEDYHTALNAIMPF